MTFTHGRERLAKTDRQAQHNKELEKKKLLAEKLRRGVATPLANKEAAMAPAVDESPPREAMTEPLAFGAKGRPARQSFGFKLRRDDSAEAVFVSATVEQLAGHLSEIAANRRTEVSLMWPGTLRAPALAHAVLTMAHWQRGNKQGARTLLYPAKTNFFQSLNHLLLDRSEVGKLAVSQYEDPNGPPNPLVTVPLRIKDAFLGSMNSIRSNGEDEIHPTVGELLPHFFFGQGATNWAPCEGDLLRHVKSKLGDRAHSQALAQLNIRSLSAPQTAPDAIFAISWKADAHAVVAALNSLKRLGTPDCIVVDATRGMRRSNPKWKSDIARFLESVASNWPTHAPGICLLTDEPHVKAQLLQELAKRGTKGNAVADAIHRAGLRTVGIPCATNRDGVHLVSRPEPLSPTARNIAVAVTDTAAAQVVEFLERIKSNVHQEDWRKTMGEVAGYLTRLASLPSSTSVLAEWLEEAEVPLSVRETYTWPSQRAKLAAISNAPAFPEKARLERVIQRGDEMWTAYRNGTPFAKLLAELIELHTRGTSKCCVVFTRPTARRLAERYFETHGYDGFPEGEGFEVLRDSVRFVNTAALSAELGARPNETLVFAGLDEEALRILMLDERISPNAHLLLTRRNAAYLRQTLKAISSSTDFAQLLPRIAPVLRQLPEFPDIDERALMSREDFVLPVFSFEQGLSAAYTESEDNDPDAWEFVLDGGFTVRRGKSSKMYVYDPVLSHTLTRGFRGVSASELTEGQRLFVMSGELRELTEAALKEAGVPIAHDKRFESSLRAYHERVVGAVSTLPAARISDKARELRSRMLDQKDCPKDLPTDGTVRSWIDVAGLLAGDFDKSKPQAPQKLNHFKAFAKALGLHDVEAVFFWKSVIQPLRGVRRVDGRRLSDVYTEMLLEPEAVAVHRQLKPSVIAMLFSRAKDNVYTIEAIKRPEAEGTEDD